MMDHSAGSSINNAVASEDDRYERAVEAAAQSLNMDVDLFGQAFAVAVCNMMTKFNLSACDVSDDEFKKRFSLTEDTVLEAVQAHMPKPH